MRLNRLVHSPLASSGRVKSRVDELSASRQTTDKTAGNPPPRTYSNRININYFRLKTERPKLSDPAHGTLLLQTATPCRVRCSAWLGHGIVNLQTQSIRCPRWCHTWHKNTAPALPASVVAKATVSGTPDNESGEVVARRGRRRE